MNIGDIKHEYIDKGSFGYVDVESKVIGFDGQGRAILEFVKSTFHTRDEEPAVEEKVEEIKPTPKPTPKPQTKKPVTKKK